MSRKEGIGIGEFSRRNGEINTSLREETEAKSEKLWIGSPFVVAKDTELPAHAPAKQIPFIISTDNLPPNLSPDELRDDLRQHIRSRYALSGLDLNPQDFNDQLIKGIKNLGEFKSGNKTIRLGIINHGSRPILLPRGAEPLHLFRVPQEAEIKGKDLETALGKAKKIQMLGQKDKDWRIHYGLNDSLEKEADGVYVKINQDRDSKFWIPDSNETLRLDEFPTFREVRQYLFDEVFKGVYGDNSMPSDHLWIGQLAPQIIAPGICGILSNDVFKEKGGKLRKYNDAFQTESPLLDGRVDEGEAFSHLVEIKGTPEWVLINYVRAE